MAFKRSRRYCYERKNEINKNWKIPKRTTKQSNQWIPYRLRRSSLTIRPCSWIRQGRDEIGWQSRPTYKNSHTYHTIHTIHSYMLLPCLEEPLPFCFSVHSYRPCGISYSFLGSSSDSWSNVMHGLNWIGSVLTSMYVLFCRRMKWEKFSYVRIFFFLACVARVTSSVVWCSMFNVTRVNRMQLFIA